jgi:hypothetical protein
MTANPPGDDRPGTHPVPQSNHFHHGSRHAYQHATEQNFMGQGSDQTTTVFSSERLQPDFLGAGLGAFPTLGNVFFISFTTSSNIVPALADCHYPSRCVGCRVGSTHGSRMCDVLVQMSHILWSSCTAEVEVCCRSSYITHSGSSEENMSALSPPSAMT